MKTLIKIMTFWAFLGFAGVASADVITCTSDVTVNGDEADLCMKGDDATSSVGEANTLFPDGWVDGAKVEGEGVGILFNFIGLTFTGQFNDEGELTGGTFSLADFFDPLLIAIKGGSQGSAFYYLFDPVNPDSSCTGMNTGNAICGTYGNLSLVGPQGQLQAISNIMWFVKDGTTTRVPEPGTLALLGLGLVGLAFARRRKIAV